MELEIVNSLEKTNQISSELLKEKQNNFLDSSLGKAINGAIDAGLKILLPDSIEKEVIDIKNALLKGGLKEGINSVIQNVINLGKRLLGIESDSFKNINQVKTSVDAKNISKLVSDSINIAVNTAIEKDFISKDIGKVIKEGKNIFFDNINKNISNEVDNQIENINKIHNYSIKWRQAYEKQNFSSMEKQYHKIEQLKEKIIPLENILKNVHEIENIHSLIKNNNQNFNLSSEQIKLAQNLV